MLINLTNHSSENWEKKQIAEAEKLYVKVVDLSFPQIDPSLDEVEVENLVNQYFRKCMELLKDNNDERNAVHLMGEFTFVFQLTYALLNKGIEVVASSTKRESVEENGIKVSKFNFVRFRKYKIPPYNTDKNNGGAINA